MTVEAPVPFVLHIAIVSMLDMRQVLFISQRLQDEMRKRGAANIMAERTLTDHRWLLSEQILILGGFSRLYLCRDPFINAQLLLQMLMKSTCFRNILLQHRFVLLDPKILSAILRGEGHARALSRSTGIILKL